MAKGKIVEKDPFLAQGGPMPPSVRIDQKLDPSSTAHGKSNLVPHGEISYGSATDKSETDA